ncbi:MAG: hypothetical protein QG553_732 [Patescibacteria group bacterium]|nr:hypothetical protein [Patescibacteria group bacterium]
MKKFAAFDIDGTLIRWQLYHAVVDRLAKQGKLGTTAAADLHNARMKWKRREHPDGFRAYEIALIEVFEASFDQLKASDFDIATQEVFDEYKHQTYVYTRDLIKALKEKGYILLAISGSQTELVKHIAEAYGFDDFVGSVYERSGDKFSGQKTVASHDKKEVLERLIEKHQLSFSDSWAVGDSTSDAVMLDMVTNPVAFNPDMALYKEARRQKWKIVVERKNVIYELEEQDGNYLLA